ncbi:MAG: hypothetical protein ABRQ39_20185 [Candidatus Eremiobacterota bacterium]
MKRNTVKVIKVIIVICVIVIAVGVWNYETSHTPYCKKGNIYYNRNNSNCPKCGSSDIKCIAPIGDGSGDCGYSCNKCKWTWTYGAWECLKCGNFYLKYDGRKYSCPKCGWEEYYP